MKPVELLLIGACVCFLVAGEVAAQEKLTLEQSVQIAFDSSPVMQKAWADVWAAEGAAGQVIAGFLPQLAVTGGFGKYYSRPSSVQITTSGTTSVFTFGTNEQADSSSYTASFSQPVFTGGRLVNSLGAAQKGLQIMREELKKTEQSLRFDVTAAYYNVILACKMVELNEQSVAMAQSHLDHNRALFKAGMATKAEVLRGEVQLAQTNINLTKARQGLELTKNNFNNVLGKDLDSLVELAETSFEAGTTVFYDYPVLLATAFENRPEWKQYILNQQIKADELRVAYSGLLPSVSLTGNLNGGLTRYAAYQSDTTSWTALLSASWNIFDGTATLNKIKEAEAKLEAEKAREMTLKLNLSLEVKNANFVLKSAKENLESTAKALELAEENFKVADLRYNEGAGGNLEVIDAQVALTRARVDNVNARHDLLLAKARINKVLGKEIYQ